MVTTNAPDPTAFFAVGGVLLMTLSM